MLLAGLGVAVLTAVLPYSLEFAALRHLSPGAAGILVSLEPAVAGVAGILILAEIPDLPGWLGIGCVVCAAAAVTARARRVARRGKENRERDRVMSPR